MCTHHVLLLSRHLCIQLWHIVIPICLVEVASHRVAQVVPSSKIPSFEVGSPVHRSVGQMLLCELNLPWLLVDEEAVTMKASALRWTGSNVGGQHFLTEDP